TLSTNLQTSRNALLTVQSRVPPDPERPANPISEATAVSENELRLWRNLGCAALQDHPNIVLHFSEKQKKQEKPKWEAILSLLPLCTTSPKLAGNAYDSLVFSLGIIQNLFGNANTTRGITFPLDKLLEARAYAFELSPAQGAVNVVL